MQKGENGGGQEEGAEKKRRDVLERLRNYGTLLNG